MKVSLARTSMWVRQLGTIAEAQEFLGLDYADPTAPSLFRANSPFGTVTALSPPIGYSATPGYFTLPPSPLGSGQPHWQPR